VTEPAEAHAAPPGYARLVPLDRQRHSGLGCEPKERFGFARRLHIVPLYLVEFLHAQRFFPIVFVAGSGGEPVPVALLSLNENGNAFVESDGSWRTGIYIPAWIRRWPFFTVEATGKEGALICVDDTALTKSDSPYFDAKGHPTSRWERVDRLVKEIEDARLQTNAFARLMQEHGLLAPFEAHAMPDAGRVKRVRGMLRVDEDKLNTLSAETLAGMMRQGQLARLYAHLFSLENFRTLMRQG